MMKWDRPEYQRIVRAENQGDVVVVLFEDGSRVAVRAEQLVPGHMSVPDWSELKFDSNEITVPAGGDKQLEVSWFTIRALTDRNFATHLAQTADEEARQIGRRLRELRKTRGMSGKELSERAGIAPQSLSRIENGHHDVTFTTLRRLLGAMGCSLQDLAETEMSEMSFASLLRALRPLGFTKRFLLRRIVPRELLGDAKIKDEELVVRTTARVLSDVYGWPVSSILQGRRLSFDTGPIEHVLFKRRGTATNDRTTAYTLYAHWLAVQIMEATPNLKPRKLESDPLKIRNEVVATHKDLSFRTLLSYVWDKGIVVLPLSDEGIFHGACWRIGDRIAIVVKQGNRHHARWLFDLAHELAHAILHLSDKRPTIVEPEEISHFPDGEEEGAASSFAQDLIFEGKVENLAQVCVRSSRGDLRKLKAAVPQVAKQNRVPADALANYMAYRLSMQGMNWWGAANNMQIEEPSPLGIARKELKARIQLDRINPEDRRIILQALEDEQ